MGWMIRSSDRGRSKNIFSRTSRAALWSIQSHIPWAQGLLSGHKAAGACSWYLPMFSCEIKNESSCTCTAIKWLHGDDRVGPSDPWTRVNPSYTDLSGSGFISNTLHIKRSPMSVISYKSHLLPTDEVDHVISASCFVGSTFELQLGNRVPWGMFFCCFSQLLQAHIYSSAMTTSIRSYIKVSHNTLRWPKGFW